MTKKHFIALADSIKEFNKTAFWGTDSNGLRGKQNIPIQGSMLEMLAEFCASQNPRFNRQRWVDYIAGECGPSGGKVKGIPCSNMNEFDKAMNA